MLETHSLILSSQAENKESGKLAALKRMPISDETELDNYMVEIDILTECKHPNIVGMLEAFLFDSTLWVSGQSLQRIPTLPVMYLSCDCVCKCYCCSH